MFARPHLLALGAAAALAAAGLAAWGAVEWGRHSARADLEQRCSAMRNSLRAGAEGPREAMLSVRGFWEAVGPRGISPDEFRRFSDGAVKRLPALAALEYFAVVTAAERESFLTRMRQLYPEFRLKELGPSGIEAAAERRLHTVLSFMNPMNAEVLGLDLEFDPRRIQMRVEAEASGQPTLSQRFTLVEDAPGKFSLAAFGQVEGAWLSGMPELKRGLVVVIFRIDPLLADLLGKPAAAFYLLDRQADPDARLLFETAPGLSARTSGLRSVDAVPFFNRTYDFVCVEDFAPGLLPPLLASLVFALTFMGVGLGLSRGRERRLSARVHALSRYQVDGEIAEGSTSTVLLARQEMLKRPAALKVFKETDPKTLARFEREVRLLSQLNHPNTIRVYDFGRTAEGKFFYAMELVEGYTLEQLVALEGPLPEGRVVRLMTQAAGAVSEAHGIGLLHRDLSPRNIMACIRGGAPDVVKVLDFGLARRHERSADEELSGISTTQAGEWDVAGTPGFVAPELITGSPPTPQSDVFALGATAYQLLCGKLPFSGTSMPAIFAATLQGQAPLLSTGCAVSPPLEALIHRCLASEPSVRPATAQELAFLFRDCSAACQPWPVSAALDFWRRHPQPLSVRPLPGEVRVFAPR